MDPPLPDTTPCRSVVVGQLEELRCQSVGRPGQVLEQRPGESLRPQLRDRDALQALSVNGVGGRAGQPVPEVRWIALDVDQQQVRQQRRRQVERVDVRTPWRRAPGGTLGPVLQQRSAEHTSELQSLMRISYAVFCLKK